MGAASVTCAAEYIRTLTRWADDFPAPACVGSGREGDVPVDIVAAVLEIPASGVSLEGRRVLIGDDVLATGGTLSATARLVESAGGSVEGIAVVLEIEALGGRSRIDGYPLTVLAAV
ncbi:hypothetical protein G4H71_20695 [Rhodococcus triatomae]|uniref:adenine phosphoribosyltransferase n=1 Tax=Rhodococcus triatomae TaxID=300028 RepID=A0A1G8KK44_9NOCA|nr:hypothetical protein G4H72_09685 [Rhodococcus triatomae]QNG25136.1 hypothetical protein G4H71_20695 [Rhodococcus triatomae]SDI43768.1 Phosphoribosyl transferase domain-containing protein [Rhodococcus triatomae]